MFVSVYVMVFWRSLADKIISKTKFSGYIHTYVYIFIFANGFVVKNFARF